jgi:DNA-binding transcriptional regulator YdaS (Cro superfamily)
MKHETPPNLIDMAIKIAGSQTRLGELCGVSQNAIWSARQAGRVSAELAVSIESATDGKIPRWKLRPDLWDAPKKSGAAA